MGCESLSVAKPLTPLLAVIEPGSEEGGVLGAASLSSGFWSGPMKIEPVTRRARIVASHGLR